MLISFILAMSVDQVSSLFSQGTTKTYHIPIEHLDYKFIEQCTDVKYLEKILRILRSGEEGFYPDLTLFCEKRIESLAPNSRALRREKPPATASDFTTEEWEKINSEMKSWVTEMKEEEYKMQYATTDVFKDHLENLPPVRSSDCNPICQVWFDVEKECSKMDGNEGNQFSKSSFNTNAKLPKMKVDTAGMTTKEKNFIANREKEKGNEAFVTGDYKEAVAYYVRKVEQKKLSDIEKNLKESKPIPQSQTKGRKIFIRDIEESDEQEGRNEEELEDGSREKKTAVLVGGDITSEKTEMGNAQKKFPSKGDGCKSEYKDAQKTRDPSENSKKGFPEKKKEPVLQDRESKVNGYLSSGKNNSENREEKTKVAESSSAGTSRPTLLPPIAATLKAEGNELYKNGQFGEAILKYSEAIENVISSGIQSPEDLSILYSNRAACYLKEGNSTDCIQDCNSALELHPYSLKPLLRRAMAYESMERYRQAYVDYKTLLQIDSGIQAANDSVNRITRMLIDQDGPNWREKLPPIPVVPVSAQLHWWDGGNLTSEAKLNKTSPKHGNQKPQISSGNSEELFTILKKQGNEFVKKGNYEEALKKYNECMKLNSQELTIYTNRALCCLKLSQYEEAIKDCDYVLQANDSNIKALYRRALAYKGLENYKASIDDLNKVLLINPSIDEAKTELQKTTQLLKLKNDVITKKQKQRKTIEIQEANECEEEEDAETNASENVAVKYQSAKRELETTVPLNSSEKLIISKPSNAYEFGQIINVVNANKDITACAELLRVIEPKDLPVFLSNKLEGSVFLIFIQALQSDVFCQDPDLVYQHLVHLSKAERFKMVLSLLSKNEVEQVQRLFDSLAKAQKQQFSLDDLKSLKRDFEL
ncbi:hypothetical protein JD844_015882 [Phrynosoma platyrhinos]|uniref:RNA-polymerase II-associated protein 3-like C-terminal domain-containing protein n=1 Tax=Phrynosoma platyrhinos TaxID=52577 RepID=A0ABQ7SJQ6_PHRPL|nr:hypothetical protein JD844_015882 [Phrynosoma platyrhinos]